MLNNIFSINKKKEPNQSLNKQPWTYTNPLQSAFDAVKQPDLQAHNQSVQAKQSTQQPQMSYAPQQSTQIQGSGYGSNYASNPTNYQAPKPVTQVQAPKAPAPSAQTSWMNYVSDTAKRQQDLAKQQQEQNKNFINQKYSLANQQLGEQLPAAQKQFDTFKGNTEATIADLLAGGERQKSQAEDYQGEAQRQAAQTLRDTQGMTQRTFANLGTIDSRGEGSFAQANENTMSDFNRFTQQGLKALADKKAEIDSTVATAERNARATITQEEAKMSELARNIQYALQTNNLNQAQELTQAYNTSQQLIYDIEDSLAQTKYAFALEQQQLENELSKINSFTPEFMATGQPTNQAEYEFYIKNKDAMGDLYGGGQAGAEKQNLIGLVDQALSTNLGALSGAWGATGLGTKFGSGLETKALIDQIKSSLALDAREKLKGQGQISDNETQMLANSVAKLNAGMTEQGLKTELQEIKNVLEGKYRYGDGGGTIRVKENSSGQTGTIPANEFDPALYTQI